MAFGKKPRIGLRERLLTAFVGVSYLPLWFEILVDHQGERGELGTWIPLVVLPPVAVVLLLAAWKWTTLWRRLGLGALFVTALGGLLGFYFHNEDRFEHGFDLFHGQFSTPPLLAPLSLAGFALVGIIALWHAPGPPAAAAVLSDEPAEMDEAAD